MEHIKYFSTESDYTSATLEEPFVALAKDSNQLHYSCQELPEDMQGVQYVDLGLPSGTIWTKYNLGAEKEDDYGLYYTWGLKLGRTYSNLSSRPSTSTIEYSLDWDPVYNIYGGKWRVPSYNQCSELINSSYTTQEITTINGIQGIKVTSKINSKYLFFPFGDFYRDSTTTVTHSGCSFMTNHKISDTQLYNLNYNQSTYLLSLGGNEMFFWKSVKGVRLGTGE